MESGDNTVEIFSGTLWEAELVKSLLTDFEIDCFLKHNVITSYALEPIQAESVKMMILNKEKERAKAVVNDFYKNSK